MTLGAIPSRGRLEAAIAAIAPADAAAGRAARAAMDRKAKPRGSLGRLEDLACRIASIRATPTPGSLQPALVVAAADHGVAAEGVSAYPQEVTAQMLLTFAGGGAAVCVLARQAGARLVVVDVGVREAVDHPALLDRRVRAGTANIAHQPAMTREQAERALAVGIELAHTLADDGVGLVALGEMGIANTTAASALTAALLGEEPGAVCGRGTGIDDARLGHKIATVRRALARAQVGPGDPVGALASVGGLEIAALTGVALGAAARRVPVLLDGFITAAAALVAVRVCPACGDALVASHRSPEPGHALILAALGLEPLLELGLRLGEGSGAALALPLVASALAVLSDMATFDEARVSDAGV
jgi:nicotinate-nucleotide--dimethylbenzimidazole phosphoribosyltransferase